MNTRTLTRADLINTVLINNSLSKREASSLLTELLETLCEELELGRSIKISTFGSFNVRKKRKRMGRNPKTGTQADITARYVAVFKSSHLLKAQMNQTPTRPTITSNQKKNTIPHLKLELAPPH